MGPLDFLYPRARVQKLPESAPGLFDGWLRTKPSSGEIRPPLEHDDGTRATGVFVLDGPRRNLDVRHDRRLKRNGLFFCLRASRLHASCSGGSCPGLPAHESQRDNPAHQAPSNVPPARGHSVADGGVPIHDYSHRNDPLAGDLRAER